MPLPYWNELSVRVDVYNRTWEVENTVDLEQLFALRDSRGGGFFWLSHGKKFPVLSIRVSGHDADVHFFPDEGHPGFRCLGGAGLPSGGTTKLVFDGCDPGDGEETPNEFIMPLEIAISVAMDFFWLKQMPGDVLWFEL